MGKSGKLFKSLVAGVNVFKSPSKERQVKDDKDHVRKRSKDKCFGSFGKSTSRSREVMSVTAASPEPIEIKCVQVDSEKLKEVSPGPGGGSYGSELPQEEKMAAISEGVICGSCATQLSQPNSKEQATISDRQEELAAVKIQAAFRCYLAQRAFRALRALVRLQALARGHIVRRQAAISLRCVNGLIRIQALARGRRVRKSELGLLVQKHLQQTKHSRKKSNDGWVTSVATTQQLHAKAHVKHDVVTKRQRALVHTYTEQLNKRSKRESPVLVVDSQIDKSHWIWEWLERWTAASPKAGSSDLSGPGEDCIPVARNVEKAKSGIRGGKHVENSRKERKKTGEHAESTLHLSQRGLTIGQHEENSAVVRKEELRDLQDSGKLQTPKLSEPKSVSQPLPPPIQSPSPLNGGIPDTKQEFNLPDFSPSASAMLSDMPISECVAEVIQPNSPGSDSSLTTANAINPSESGMMRSSDNKITSNLVAASPTSPPNIIGAANGQSVVDANEASLLDSDSLSPKDCQQISLLASSFSPEESCITSEPLTSVDSVEETTVASKAATHGSLIQELAVNLALNRTPESEEIQQHAPHYNDLHDDGNAENGEKLLTDESDGTIQELVVMEEDAKTALSPNQDNSASETNGVCKSMKVSAGAKLAEGPSRSPSGLGSKVEQIECISPSLPSYMATTMSSKAKIRANTSPKQKADLVKQKQESPKPKSDSPKTKGDSPSQKPDSALKRRQSLSALDGRLSLGTQNQKPASHARANSKGNFSSMKDLSTDHLTFANGDSSRYGK